MNQTTAFPPVVRPAGVDETSTEHYCPTTLLAMFTLLMAGHGCCVSADLMLGDRHYAKWQLALGRTLGDAELREVSRRLSAYFESWRVAAMASHS